MYTLPPTHPHTHTQTHTIQTDQGEGQCYWLLQCYWRPVLLITSLRKSTSSETIFLLQTQLLALILLSLEIPNFWACRWWICLKNNQQLVHLPSLVNSIPFPPHFFMKTLTSSRWQSQTLSTHLLPLALYQVIWRLPSSNLCWKSYQLTKIFRKTTTPFLTSHFCPKSLKKLFSTNFSPISKKATSATPFSQPIKQDTALRLFC